MFDVLGVAFMDLGFIFLDVQLKHGLQTWIREATMKNNQNNVRQCLKFEHKSGTSLWISDVRGIFMEDHLKSIALKFQIDRFRLLTLQKVQLDGIL